MRQLFKETDQLIDSYRSVKVIAAIIRKPFRVDEPQFLSFVSVSYA